MSHWMKRVRKDEEGLTLIELIVVVAIIGVLAWLITPRVLGALETSKYRSAESAANEIHAALERSAAATGIYPNPTVPSGKTVLEVLLAELDVTLSKPANFMDVDSFDYATDADDKEYCAGFFVTAKNQESDDLWITHAGVETEKPSLSFCPTVTATTP